MYYKTFKCTHSVSPFSDISIVTDNVVCYVKHYMTGIYIYYP